jgi:hypothetical protein
MASRNRYPIAASPITGAWARRAMTAIVAALVVLVHVGAAHADDPPAPDPLFVAVGKAFAFGQTQTSPVRGIHDPKRAFTELPPGCVLVGFDCGIGKIFDIETVYALRAIYRSANGIEFGQEHGPFIDRVLGPKKVIKTRVLRTETLQAPPGYAVGGVTIRTGLNINGLSLTYMKIDGTRLDLRKTLASPWVGDRTGGGEASIGGNGAVVLGIVGCKDDTHVHSLGIVTMKSQAVVAQLPANPPPAPPVDKAAPVEPPPAAVDPLPAPPPIFKQPPRPGQAAAEPQHPPADAAPQDDAPVPAIQAVELAAPKAAKTGKYTPFVLIGVGGTVAVAVLGLTLMLLGSKKRTIKPAPRRTGPPPLPKDFTAGPGADPTAIREKPALATVGAVTDPADVLEPEPIVLLPADGIQSGLPKRPVPPRLPAVPAEPATSPDVVLPAGPDSRGPTLACGTCYRAVPSDLGSPPWCPYCGGDLKAPPMLPLTYPEDASAKVALAKLLQPPYFVGRAGRSYRIYIVPGRLLFIDCPASDDRGSAENVVRGVSIQGGLVGAMVGGLISDALQSDRLAKSRDRNWTVNMADISELIEMAERESDSFVVDIDDLQEVQIEALTFWQHTFADRCSARLRFVHPIRGRMSIDLPRPDDVRVAIKQLTPTFGDRIAVNATWDWRKERYVQNV